MPAALTPATTPIDSWATTPSRSRTSGRDCAVHNSRKASFLSSHPNKAATRVPAILNG